MNDVQVFLLNLPAPDSDQPRLISYLSAEERARWERFGHPLAGQRFLAGRGLLRGLLGRWLNCSPTLVPLQTEGNGKPFLALERGQKLAFSVSHSGDLVGVAIGTVLRLGLDVEALREEYDAAPIVRRFFTPEEFEDWQAVPAGQQSKVFFRAWTRREAYLKGTGEGISGIGNVRLTMAHDQPRALLSCAGDPDAPKRWWFSEFTRVPGYVAALAVEGPLMAVEWRPIGWEILSQTVDKLD